jgi:thioredoxin-related protein
VGKVKPILTGLFAGLICLAVIAQDKAPARIKWIKSHKKGLRLAKKEGKPIMLFFHRKGCSVCKKVRKGFRKRKDIIEASRALVCISIDTDRDTRTIFRYIRNPKTLPHIFFLKPSGKVISHFYEGGYKEKLNWKKLLKKMKKLAEKYTIEKEDDNDE